MGGTDYAKSRKWIGKLLCLESSPLYGAASYEGEVCLLIKSDDLATLHIHRLIFHDVPKRVRGLESAPVLSEIEATLDEDRISHLKRRLVRVLGSKSAYDIHFRPDTQSPVPPLIRTTQRAGNIQTILFRSRRSSLSSCLSSRVGRVPRAFFPSWIRQSVASAG
jgi:hypothetical protein